jgi:adenine C2-methylase RlmN of 23S rRNA A2503 and tRNA A37
VELNRFRDQLQALGVPIVRRYSVGRSQNAACGMLARVFQEHASAQ